MCVWCAGSRRTLEEPHTVLQENIQCSQTYSNITDHWATQRKSYIYHWTILTIFLHIFHNNNDNTSLFSSIHQMSLPHLNLKCVFTRTELNQCVKQQKMNQLLCRWIVFKSKYQTHILFLMGKSLGLLLFGQNLVHHVGLRDFMMTLFSDVYGINEEYNWQINGW